MTKTFIYKVNESTFVDNKAFGQAWHTAVTFAKEHHAGITRLVIDNNGEHREFLAKGCVFLNEQFYSENNIKIF